MAVAAGGPRLAPGARAHARHRRAWRRMWPCASLCLLRFVCSGSQTMHEAPASMAPDAEVHFFVHLLGGVIALLLHASRAGKHGAGRGGVPRCPPAW